MDKAIDETQEQTASPVAQGKIAEITIDPNNANKGRQRGRALIEKSLRKYGFGRSVLLDKNKKVIAGNHATEIAGEVGMEDVIFVPTDGKKIIAVVREDLDLDSKEARALAIADNRTNELNLDFDPEMLKQYADDGVDISQFWNEHELTRMIRDTRAKDDEFLNEFLDSANEAAKENAPQQPGPEMAFIQATFPCTVDQRKFIFDVINRVKKERGLQSSTEALISILEEYDAK